MRKSPLTIKTCLHFYCFRKSFILGCVIAVDVVSLYVTSEPSLGLEMNTVYLFIYFCRIRKFCLKLSSVKNTFFQHAVHIIVVIACFGKL